MEIYQQIAILKIEYPRRRQIFDESVAIVQKTNNFDVLFRRMDAVHGFIKWAFEQQAKGFPIKLEKKIWSSRRRMQIASVTSISLGLHIM